ncbi:MAG: hypothetical protein K6G75_10790 [Lachnospiraceae bacterium]|nr:hypothetical protein [Lachnospiraceae bacterium]
MSTEEKKKKNKKNAVLYKEMTIDMKRPKIVIIMLLLNLFIAPVAIGFFIGILIASMNGVCSYRVLAWYLIVMVYLEASVLFFITPAITAGSISLEKERQTLDVLLTTRMTPWEIIKGKYGSNLIFLSLMVVSTFPLLALVFIYGGISFIQLIYLGLTLMVFIAFISCFGIFFSTLTKNTILSVILTYLFVSIYMTFTLALPFILLGGVAFVNDWLYNTQTYITITDEHLINGDILVMFGTFSPILTLFDVIGNTIGYQIGIGESVKGMISLCETEIMPHFTRDNIIVKSWTPISLVEMSLISFLVLRLSAVILNPVKGKKKKKVNKK